MGCYQPGSWHKPIFFHRAKVWARPPNEYSDIVESNTVGQERKYKTDHKKSAHSKTFSSFYSERKLKKDSEIIIHYPFQVIQRKIVCPKPRSLLRKKRGLFVKES